MIRFIYFTNDGILFSDIELSEAIHSAKDGMGLLWLDLVDNSREEDEKILISDFGFHPLAVDDALTESHVPKLDDWGEYLYIVLHAVTCDNADPSVVDTLELDIFLGKGYLVTYHEKKIDPLNLVWKNVQRDARHLKNGSDHLLYRLVDEIVTSYMPVVDHLDNQLDLVEDQVFTKSDKALLEQIFTYKRSILHLRRIMSHQREVLNKLARDSYEVVDARARIYFRDVYDHLVRLHDLTEDLRDLVSGALDIYLSVVNNRMNDIMKTLTVITTLFMPLTFLTGFFGMNFFAPAVQLQDWTSSPAFYFSLVAMVGLPAMMLLWIRRRGWL